MTLKAHTKHTNYATILKRDFSRNRRRPIVEQISQNAEKKLDWIFDCMIPLEANVTQESLYDGILIDTCFFLRGVIPRSTKIIITDGVILEILQGCIFESKINNEFQVNYQNDLEKLIRLKKEMGDNCLFISLNSKSRQYYPGSGVKHSLRRNVDSELLLLALKIYNLNENIQLATFDNGLKQRFRREYPERVQEAIIYHVPMIAVA